MKRYYLVPLVLGGPRGTTRVPNHVWNLGVNWQGMDFGKEDRMLVAADVTTTQHLFLAGEADIFSFPENILDNVAVSGISAMQEKLETYKLPVDWITTGNTYKDIIKAFMGIFQISQRYHALVGESPFAGGVTMDTQFNQLPTTEQTAIQTIAMGFGFSMSGISGTSTMRQILKILSDQFPVLRIAGVEL